MLENKEIWKDCKGYEGKYQVSSLGRVWSVKSQKIMKSFDINKKTGYQGINLIAKNGKKKREYIHRLVALAFLENPNNFPEVNHKDENPRNNALTNLEWCDRKYNVNYGTRNKKVGEKNGKKVRQYTCEGEMVAEYYSTFEAERQTNICNQNIAKVCRGERNTAGGYVWRYADEN